MFSKHYSEAGCNGNAQAAISKHLDGECEELDQIA